MRNSWNRNFNIFGARTCHEGTKLTVPLTFESDKAFYPLSFVLFYKSILIVAPPSMYFWQGVLMQVRRLISSSCACVDVVYTSTWFGSIHAKYSGVWDEYRLGFLWEAQGVFTVPVFDHYDDHKDRSQGCQKKSYFSSSSFSSSASSSLQEQLPLAHQLMY